MPGRSSKAKYCLRTKGTCSCKCLLPYSFSNAASCAGTEHFVRSVFKDSLHKVVGGFAPGLPLVHAFACKILAGHARGPQGLVVFQLFQNIFCIYSKQQRRHGVSSAAAFLCFSMTLSPKESFSQRGIVQFEGGIVLTEGESFSWTTF